MDVLNTAINDDKSNEVRCANLRLNRIEFLKQLVKEQPDEYDAAKLDKAIEYVNGLSDDNIDAAFILLSDVDIIQRPIYQFSDSDIDRIRGMMLRLGYTKEIEDIDRSESNRCDYTARWVKNDDSVPIWLIRIRPLFDEDEYVLMAVGMNFPSAHYKNMDALLHATEELILKRKGDEFN